MKRSKSAALSMTLFVLAGCSRSCAPDAPAYGVYQSEYPAPLWTPASYVAAYRVPNGEAIPIDEHRLGFVVNGARSVLTDHATFKTTVGPEELAFGLPMPDDKGFLFVSQGPAPQTYFAERFDGPMVSLGLGTPCRNSFADHMVEHGICEHKTGRVLIHRTKAYAMASDLVVLFDTSGEHTRSVALPSGGPAPKTVPAAEDLLTLESGLSFLRGPDGLFVREPGADGWKRIGQNTVTSLSADESGVVASGSDGPTLLVDNVSFLEPFRHAPLTSKLIPTSSTTAELPEGRADREPSLLLTSRSVPYVPDLCRIVSPTHDLLACIDISRSPSYHPDDDVKPRDRIFRIMPLPEELGSDGGKAGLPEPLYPGYLPLEPTLPVDWEGEIGSTASLEWNEYGTLIGGIACNGKRDRFTACARRGYEWKTVTMSPALEAIDTKARLEFLPAPNGDILILAKEPDGALTIALATTGRNRRFPTGELPSAIRNAFSDTSTDGGTAADADPSPVTPVIRHNGEEPPTAPQRLVTPRSNLRILLLVALLIVVLLFTFVVMTQR